jgi:hypothetical protein
VQSLQAGITVSHTEREGARQISNRGEEEIHLAFVQMTHSARRVHFQGEEPLTWFDNQELSVDEERAYWLRSADFAEFERNRRAMERALRRARGDFNQVDATQWCFRGMEEMLSAEYACRMIVLRSNVIMGVLDEQARQRCQGYRDDESIRQMSMAMSECANNARSRPRSA